LPPCPSAASGNACPSRDISRKLNKKLLGADAGGTTDFWKDSIPFWVTVDDVPVGTTGGWANERYTDGETFDADHPGWLYIGDFALPDFEGSEAVKSAVVQFWVKYAVEHNFAGISTNEVESNGWVPFWQTAGFKEVGRDENFGPDDPNIILELEF
jgi:hypothetical protein